MEEVSINKNLVWGPELVDDFVEVDVLLVLLEPLDLHLKIYYLST
jgi:hypothetical protein